MPTFKHVDFEVPDWGELSQAPKVWHAHHQAVLDLNPLAYWRLGETDGVTAYDELGTHNGTYRPGNNGAWTGGDHNVAGALYRDTNPGASFDPAAPGWIELPFIALPSEFTITAWMKASDVASSSGNTIFSWGEDDWIGHAVEFRLYETSGGASALQYQLKDANGSAKVHGSTGLRDGQWHHVAVTRDGTAITLYVDGSVENSGTIDASPNLHHTQIGLLRRGSGNLANPIEGTLDEIVFFDHVLSVEAIADLHRRGTGQFKPLP